ncbi:MAG: PKD domain-containing protein [Bacteroidetes bacterium]|nr:PKD domain-containing protein [Bacteroidota bacterium]
MKKIIYIIYLTFFWSFMPDEGVIASKIFNVRLLPPPPTLSPLSDVCEKSKSFTLSNGSPVGGIYSGPGVTGNTFDPAKAGVGTHTITYTIYVAGVPSSATTTIKVNPLPKPAITGGFVNCVDSGGKQGGYPPIDGYTCSVSSSTPGNGSSHSAIPSVCANTDETYTTPNNPGSTYTWIVGGGTVTSGLNSSSAIVHWGIPGSGTIQIVETNSFGCSDTSGVCVNIKPTPTANFLGTTSCLGIATQFTDMSVGAVSWLWDFGDGTTSTEKNPSHIYGSCGSFTVKLTVKGKCDCPDVITKTVSVNCSPGPKIICPSTVCANTLNSPYSTDAVCTTYNWSVTGGTITGGQNTPNILVDWGTGPVGTITLSTAGCTPANCTTPTTVNIPILPTNPVITGYATPCQWTTYWYGLPAFPGGVYTWTIVPAASGQIMSGQGSNQVSVQWKNPTNPNAQLVVTVGNPFIGCKSTATLPVKILPQFSAYGNNQVCRNSNSTVTANPTGSYNWTTTGGTISSGQGTAVVTINWNVPAGTYTVTATPSTAGVYCNSSYTTTITVVDTPPVDSISGDKYICPGTTHVYTAWSTAAGVTYSWTAVNGTLSSTSGNPVSVTWGAAGPYSVSVTQQPSYPACASSPVTISVKDIKTTAPPITGLQVACVNGTYTYSLPDLPGAIYNWTLNPSSAGSVISGQGGNIVQIQYNASGNATINVAISLCSTPVNVSLSVLVNPAPSPVINITGNLCPGSTVTLSSAGVFPAYEWKDGTMTVIGTTSSISVPVPATAKPYVLTVTNSNGCQGKTITSLVAAPEPKADISTPDKRDYCTGDVISTALYAQVGPGYTYQWYYNATPAGTGNSLTATTTGTYYVVVTNASGCTKTSSSIVITQGPCGGGPPGCIPLPMCGMPPCVPPPPGCVRVDSIAIDFFGNGSSWLKPKPPGGEGKFPDIGASVMSVPGNDPGEGVKPFATKIFCTNLINYTDNSPITTIAWYWDFGDGSSSTLQNPPHTYAKAGYYYVVFWAQFTKTAFGKASKSIEIPVVGDFESQVSCGTATFTDLSTHTPTSPITGWSWNFGDASTSTSQNPVHTYAAPGTYNVTLTVTAGGCTSTINKNVVVSPFPVAQFSFPTACAGTPTPFTDASTSVGTTILFWDWDFGDGTTSQLQNPTHTYIAGGTYTVKLKVTDINGCTNTKTQSVTITAPSGAGVIAASGPLTFCVGQSVTLTAPAATSYLWSNGSTMQSITVNQSGDYSVATFSSGGCQAAPPPVTVIVKPLPDATLSNTVGTICAGSSFCANVPFKTGLTYQWYNGGGAMAGKTSSSLCTSTAGIYYIRVTDASSSCSASSSPVTVSSLPSPATPTVTGPASFCQGSAATITASTTGGTTPYTYSWNTGETTASITVKGDGYFYFTLTDKNGCKAYGGKSLTINPLPDLSIFPVGCYTRCDADTIFGPPGYASYQWQRNGANIATTQDIIAATSGNYKLIVTTSLGCKDTSGELSLTIAPKPVANAGPDVTLCTGTTQLNGTGGTIYLWNPPTFLNNVNIANPISTPASTIDYELLVTDKNGCKDKDSVKITVSCANPVVVATGASVCPGSCTNITAVGSAGTPPYTYTWSSGQTGAGPHNFCPAATSIYTVIMFDVTGASDTDTVVVIVHPIMTLTPTSNNVLCTSANNGSAAINVAGGTPAYTYTWSSSGGTAATTPNTLSPGSYTVTVTDGKGCSKTSVATITEPPPITVTPSSTPANCGASDGTVSVSAGGGTGIYTYSWSPGGATGSTVTGLSAGTYITTVTDANGCTATTSALINNMSGPTATTQFTNVTCFGGADGTAQINASGGTGIFTYSWQPSGGTGVSASGLSAGTYTVSVNDGGCVITSTVVITQPPQINATATATDATCGAANGSAMVTAGGGTGSLNYSWQPIGGTGLTAINLSAGSYTVVVTDANGCSVTTSALVNSSSGPTVTMQSTNITCYGAGNGTAQANATGGSGVFTYSWQPSGGTGASVGNLSAGTYSVSVNSGGCTVTSTVTITEPPQINVAVTTTDAACGSANGSATVTASGGIGTLAYSWQPSGGTGITESNLIAGSYTVVVTDANACTSTSIGIVNNTGSLAATIQSSTNATCNGSSDGTASVIPAGGTSPYTYSWSVAGATASTINNLSAGTYTVTTTDANNCQAITTVTITEPAKIVLTTTAIDAACGSNNGSVSVSATGGAGSLNYSWTPGGSTGITVNGLSAGGYTVSVTDANGCSSTATALVGNLSGPTATTQFTNVTCFGGTDGTAQINATGGTGIYTYSWQPSGGTGASAIGLSAGTYTVSVNDGGCSITSTITITEPPQINVSVAATDAACGAANGSVVVSASGGIGTLAYSWQPSGGTGVTEINLAAGSYTVTVTDANNCTATSVGIVNNAGGLTAAILSSANVTCNGLTNGNAVVNPSGGATPFTYNWSDGGTAATANNLSAGIYSVTVSDANNCAAITTITITEPSKIILATATVDANCGSANGSATVSVTGGITAYTYLWTPGGAASPTASGLSAGIYTVSVTDANGCSETLTALVNNLSGPSITTQSTNVSCFGGNDGTAQVNATGGTGTYTYSWLPSGSTSAFVNGLIAGTYTINVSDASGCLIASTVSITEPVQMTISVAITDASCGAANGNVVVTASGSGTLSYTWAPVGGTGATASSLIADTYTVTITDANGCSQTTAATVGNTGPIAVAAAMITGISCNGGSDGSAIATIGGGTAPITYSWSPVGGTGITAANLSAGSYTVNVTDSKGCSAISIVTITEPGPMALVVPSPTPVCIGQSAILTAVASGGTAAYNYTWMPGSLLGSNISVSPATTTSYTVNVSDANGCTSVTQTVTVNVRPPLQVDAGIDKNICIGDSTTLTAIATGGDGNYTYTWQPMNITGASINVTPPVGSTTYTVVVSDGCGTPSANDTVTVKVNTAPSPVFVADTTSGCEPVCVKFTNTTPGGTKTCSWDFGDGGTSSDCSPVNCYRKAGSYTVNLTVSDSAGCTASVSQTNYITVHPLPDAAFKATPTLTTILAPTIVFTDKSSTDVVKWDWNFGDVYNSSSSKQNPTYTYKDTGRYEVQLVVTSVFGCVDTVIDYVKIEGDYTFYVPNAFTPNGDGNNDAFFPKGFMINPECYKMMIFDRWGNLIFETEDLNVGWDGRANGGKLVAQQDVYVWKIQTCNFKKERKFYVGHVTLVK